MTSNFLRTVSIAAAAAAAAIAAAPASAIDYDVANSAIVRHDDLDLTGDAGVSELNRRIARAARAVCGTFNAVDLRAKASALACRKTANADAAPKVELAVAAARGGQRLAAAPIGVSRSVP